MLKYLYYALFFACLAFVSIMGFSFVVEIFTSLFNITFDKINPQGYFYIIWSFVYLFIYAGLFFGAKEFELNQKVQGMGAVAVFLTCTIYMF